MGSGGSVRDGAKLAQRSKASYLNHIFRTARGIKNTASGLQPHEAEGAAGQIESGCEGRCTPVTVENRSVAVSEMEGLACAVFVGGGEGGVIEAGGLGDVTGQVLHILSAGSSWGVQGSHGTMLPRGSWNTCAACSGNTVTIMQWRRKRWTGGPI